MSENFSGFQRAAEPNERPFSRVEGMEAEAAEDTPEASSEETSESITKTNALLQKYKLFLTTFAKDTSLTYKAGDAFKIDTESGTIYNDVRWFTERDMSPDQIIWAYLHEITHFRDLREDKEGNEARRRYEVTKARATGLRIMEKWAQALPPDHPKIEGLRKQIPLGSKDGTQLNRTEAAAFKIYHTFFNVLDDIWVNSSVARRAPRYAANTKGGNEVERLYREKLFKGTDYTEQPLHMQFLYALLRGEMVSGEEVIVSDAVREILDQPLSYKGKNYLPKEIVARFIKPRGQVDTRMSSRDAAVSETLEPLFEVLLAKDLDTWEPKVPEPKEQGEGGNESEAGAGEGQGPSESTSANPFEEAYEEFEENNPDQFTEEDLDDLAEHDESEEKKEEVRPIEKKIDTPEETKAKLDEGWLQRNNIDRETWDAFRVREKEIEPYLEELSRFWRDIVYGKSEKMSRKLGGHFTTGSNLDIQKAIDEFPQIERGEMHKARVMERMLPEGTVTENKPELIRVRLMGDLSSSMEAGGRIEALQRCYILLLSSLNEFNTYLDITRGTTGTKLKVETQVYGFGERARIVKPLEGDLGAEDARAAIVKAYASLTADDGNTLNGQAYQNVVRSLSPENRKNIEEKKTLELIFEITDGGSGDAVLARQKIDELIGLGAVVRGFQIGNPHIKEREIFNRIWNERRGEEVGKFIGNDLKNLLPALTELLKEHLREVQL
jgi:hypothetical protein